jgi:hypothetical protein
MGLGVLGFMGFVLVYWCKFRDYFFIEKILFWKDFLSGFGSGIYGGREASAPLAARFDNERKIPGSGRAFRDCGGGFGPRWEERVRAVS